MSKRADILYPIDYIPDFDASPELELVEVSFFQSLTGITRWMIELGCFDVATELSFFL